MKVKFHSSVQIAKNIRTFSFEPPKKPSHIAGQFIELYLPHDNKDNRGEKRWFTLSSSPTEDLLSITTRITDPNGSSFKNRLKVLTPGDELSMSSPMGDFVLPKDKSIRLVFVAGGIGCTPFRSITKYLIDTNEMRDVTMIYNANNLEDVAFIDIFNFYQDKFHKIIGERLSARKILDTAGESDKTTYYFISGPEPMVEGVLDELKKSGINKKHIHTDFFPGYTQI